MGGPELSPCGRQKLGVRLLPGRELGSRAPKAGSGMPSSLRLESPCLAPGVGFPGWQKSASLTGEAVAAPGGPRGRLPSPVSHPVSGRGAGSPSPLAPSALLGRCAEGTRPGTKRGVSLFLLPPAATAPKEALPPGRERRPQLLGCGESVLWCVRGLAAARDRLVKGIGSSVVGGGGRPFWAPRLFSQSRGGARRRVFKPG